MQARHAKVNHFHDHAAIHRYRQSSLDKLASSKHTSAHRLSKLSDDSSNCHVATGDKNNSKSDDDTQFDIHTNLHVFYRSATCVEPHYFSPSSAKGASRATALNSVNSVRVKLPDGRTCDLGELTITERPRVAATRTPPAAKPGCGAKRAGAKAVKKMERESVEYKLSPEDATTFRALSARANYLSQDRADIGFSTKELCREFAVPNRHSQAKLKRVCRYLAGKPRLVHQYNWGDGANAEQTLEVFVDTDFAGC